MIRDRIWDYSLVWSCGSDVGIMWERHLIASLPVLAQNEWDIQLKDGGQV